MQAFFLLHGSTAAPVFSWTICLAHSDRCVSLTWGVETESLGSEPPSITPKPKLHLSTNRTGRSPPPRRHSERTSDLNERHGSQWEMVCSIWPTTLLYRREPSTGCSTIHRFTKTM